MKKLGCEETFVVTIPQRDEFEVDFGYEVSSLNDLLTKNGFDLPREFFEAVCRQVGDDIHEDESWKDAFDNIYVWNWIGEGYMERDRYEQFDRLLNKELV